MKVFLLIRTEQDDFDVIYGIYSSLENANIASHNENFHGAEIKEVQLDVTYELGV